MNKKNRKGFTIVELVIVIAVIGILATVLIPTFGDVIDKANASKDLQAAKNAYTQYVSNFDYTKGDTEDVVYYDGKEVDIVITNGNAVEGDLPASGTCYNKITDKGVVSVEVNGCTNTEHGHTAG